MKLSGCSPNTQQCTGLVRLALGHHEDNRHVSDSSIFLSSSPSSSITYSRVEFPFSDSLPFTFGLENDFAVFFDID